MTKFIALIFAFCLTNTAFATWIAPVSVGICTRDINQYGQSGHCQCPHATRYESALGRCVQGAPIDSTVEGAIASVPTVEGESSFILTDKAQGQYELILKYNDRADLEAFQAQGLNYSISGEVLEAYDATQSGATPLFIVRSLKILHDSPAQ